MKAAWYNGKFIGEDLFTHSFILSFLYKCLLTILCLANC